MTLPASTDYDRPDFSRNTCDYCGEDEEGGYVKDKWVCNWCHEELEWINQEEEE